MKKVWLYLFSAACCVCALFSRAAAAPEAPPPAGGSIEILRLADGAPVENTDISLYRVADYTNGRVVWTAEYAEYQLTLDPGDETSFGALPQNLAAVIDRDNKAPLAAVSTGADGKAFFPGLDDGLYLITGERYVSDGYYHDPIPTLVFIPCVTGGQPAGREVYLELKHNTGQLSGQTVNRRVLKVWDDAGHERRRPETVTVQLLNGGVVADTQVLSPENDWRFTWTGLEGDGAWSVAEYGVPERYSVSVREEGVTFVVTNTYVDTSGTPGSGSGDSGQSVPSGEDTQSPVDVPDNPVPGAEGTEDAEGGLPGEDLPPAGEAEVSESGGGIPGTGDISETGGGIPGTGDISEAGEDIPEEDIPLVSGLPQTGQPWMPVVLCSGLGIACILAGLVMKRRERADEA